MSEELLEPWLRRLRIRRIIPWIPQNAVVCDVGCGFDAQSLRSISGFIEKGYGFDKKVRSQTSDTLIVRNHDLMDPLPLPDNSVNCVTMIAVLEHLSHIDEIFKEISRISRPKGRVILTTPSPSSKKILEFLAFRIGIVSPEEIADHKHYWSIPEIEDLFLRYGFIPVHLQTFSAGLNTLAIGEKKSE